MVIPAINVYQWLYQWYLTCFDECKCGKLSHLEFKQLFSCITTFKFVLLNIIPTEIKENGKYIVLLMFNERRFTSSHFFILLILPFAISNPCSQEVLENITTYCLWCTLKLNNLKKIKINHSTRCFRVK